MEIVEVFEVSDRRHAVRLDKGVRSFVGHLVYVELDFRLHQPTGCKILLEVSLARQHRYTLRCVNADVRFYQLFEFA